jgi:hypothetical protein
MHQTANNTGPTLSASTLTVLHCLASGLDLVSANFIASIGATTTTKGSSHETQLAKH